MGMKAQLKKIGPLYILHHYVKYKGFREWVKLYDSSEVLHIQEMGTKNPDKQIYVINIDRPEAGFFANWKFSVLGIAYADRYHLTPVVYWMKNNVYYQEGYGDTDNTWEYYFEPLSDIKFEDAMQSQQVVMMRPSYDKIKEIANDSYENMTNLVEQYARYNKKYVRIKERIKSKANGEIQELLQNKKTIAVHVRGVEWGHIKGHPMPIQLSEYFDVIDQAIEVFGFEQIFLATDSEDTVAVFKEKYDKKIVTHEDVLRSSKGSKTLMLFDSNITRENNRFLLGYEVLRDMLTMVACNGLIAGYSHVSLAACSFKRAEDEKYDFLHIIAPKKIVKNGMNSKKAVKLMRENKF